MLAAVAVGLGALAALVALAGPVTAQRSPTAAAARFEYAVKFVCTADIPGTSQTIPSVLPGAYETAVNVHNPGAARIAFRKKIAVAVPPGGQQAGPVSDFVTDELDADEALSVGCAEIAGDFGITFVHGAEGFLVIRSPRRLDVTAVYTAGPVGGPVASMAVERIPGARVDG